MSAIGNTVVPVREQRTEAVSASWECSKAQDQVFHIYISLSHVNASLETLMILVLLELY